MESFISSQHESIVRNGLVGPDPESVFNAHLWVSQMESDYVQTTWRPIRAAIETKVKARFGKDVQLAQGISPGRYTGLSIDEAAAQFEADSVVASLEMRKLSLRGALGKALREQREQGAVISNEEWQRRMKQLEDLSPAELEALAPERLIAEARKTYPVPAAREIAARPKLPAPLSPLEALAEDISRLARRGPVNLWIRTRSREEIQSVRWEVPVLKVPALETLQIEAPVLGAAADRVVPDAPYRSFSLDRDELKRMKNDLPGRGYWGGGMRYLLQVPSGTSREALVSLFAQTSWWYHPVKAGEPFIRIPWPIELPDLSGKLSGGLEEERGQHLALASFI